MMTAFCNHNHKWPTIKSRSKQLNVIINIVIVKGTSPLAIIMARPAHARLPSNTPSPVPEHQTTQGDQSPNLIYYYYGDESEPQQQFLSSLCQLARQIRDDQL